LKFAALHAGSGPEGYLSPDTFAVLHQPSVGASYAGGWGLTRRDWAGGIALTHNGSNTMNFAIAWVAPAKRAGVLVTTNIAYDGIGAQLDQIVWHLILRYIRDL